MDKGEIEDTSHLRGIGSDAVLNDGKVLIVGNSGILLEWDGDGTFRETAHSSGVIFAGVIHLGEGQFLLVGEGGVHFYPETNAEDSGP